MPGVIESFVLFVLTAAGVSGTALAVGVSLITGAIGIGLSVGLSYLASSLFRPEPPKPEDIQVTLKSPVAPRQRHYGRVKTSGVLTFAESKNGALFKVLALGTGLLDAIEELWVDDNRVVNSGANGLVPTAPYGNRLLIQTRLGLATETHYAHLSGFFTEWTSAHRGDGMSSLYAVQYAVKQDQISSIFPNLSNTLYRAVVRGAKVLNPVTGLVDWSDNAAAVVRDYIVHADGMRLPVSLVSTSQAAAGWLAAYNRAAEAVPRKGGGTEPRYRLWGTYRFDERPADVLGRMQECCDARIVPTPDGGVTLDIGAWEEPTVILDEDAIVGFSEVSRGRDILTTANTIRATYLSSVHDYQSTDADQWIDDADAALRGEIVTERQFILAPSHSQARRLMKLAAYRANPSWIGNFQFNLKALAAFGKRFVRIRYPLFGINEVFEVQDFRFNIGEGGILTGVSMQLISMPSTAYAWNAATEEGTAPVSENVVVDRTIPLPTGFSFGVNRITVGGQMVPVGVIQFNLAPAGLMIEGRYKRTADSAWQVIPVGDQATEAQTGALSDGDQYEAQVRHITVTGRQGAWTASQTLTVVADTTAPGVVSGVTKTGGAGTVNLGWTSPNSANYSAANIRRNTVNTEGTASLVRTEYGAPSAADGWQDTGLAAGTYYYWIKARNASGVESASVATGAVTVT
ncbi:phage tail protein [Hoeflea sp. 108]|uniref:phage tail protein n=1 Tax=Hoeflea sp. 108 TaxID=1116369 RepID=UPI00037A2B56|nr:phage tail protein [Hoeflea sp. 108]